MTHEGDNGNWYYLTAAARSGDQSDPRVRKQVAVSSAELADVLRSTPAEGHAGPPGTKGSPR